MGLAKTSNYSAEEVNLKVRLDNLKAAQEELLKLVKPQLQAMEREITDLGFSVNSGRLKLEKLFEKHNSDLLSLDIATKTFLARFASTPQP